MTDLSILPRKKYLSAVHYLLSDRDEKREIWVQKDVVFDPVRWKMRLNIRHSLAPSLFLRQIFAEDSITLKLFQKIATKSSFVVDVGANIGLFSYIAAASNPRCIIYAFEPNLELRKLIQMNCNLNHWESALFVQAEAVAEKKGVREFFEANNDSESTLIGTRQAVADGPRRYSVPTVTLDQIFADKRIDPSTALVKIDVEGAEGLVIDGFGATLSGRSKPELICEILGECMHASLIEKIITYGYHCFYIHRSALIPVRNISDLSGKFEMGFHNFYFTAN